MDVENTYMYRFLKSENTMPKSRKKKSHSNKDCWIWYIDVSIKDGTKLIPSTRSIGYRVSFKVSVSPKYPIPIPRSFQYYFDTFSILYMHVSITLSCNIIQREHNSFN